MNSATWYGLLGATLALMVAGPPERHGIEGR